MLGLLSLALSLLLASLTSTSAAAASVVNCPTGTYRSPNTGHCVDCPRIVTVTELQSLHYEETVKKAVLDSCLEEKGETTEATTTTTKILTPSSTVDAQSSSAAPQSNTPSASMGFLTGSYVASMSLAALVVLVIAAVATANSLMKKYQAVPRAEQTISTDSETAFVYTIPPRPLPPTPEDQSDASSAQDQNSAQTNQPDQPEVVCQSPANQTNQPDQPEVDRQRIDERAADSRTDPLPMQQHTSRRRVDDAEPLIDDRSADSATDTTYSGRLHRGQRMITPPDTIEE